MFSYAEEWHYNHNANYRKCIKIELALRGLRVRLPTFDDKSDTIDSFVMAMGRSKGHAPGRTRRVSGRKEMQYA